MDRLTRKDTIIVGGKERAACNYENDNYNDSCNDSCMYGSCRWQEEANMLLKKYEDTCLTPEQIMELKERNVEKAPEIHKNNSFSVYTCPICNLVLINKDEKGWFSGKHYKFCPDCGQRLKWED